MADNQNQTSAEQAQNSLDLLQQTTQDSQKLLRPPLWLNVLISLFAGLLMYSLAQASDDNPWAVIAIVSFVGFAGSYGLYLYRSRLLGVKPKTMPNSSASSINTIVVVVVFIGLNFVTRALTQDGLVWAAYVGSAIGALLFLFINHFYPNGQS